jgi:hypothetical protein
LKIHEKPFLNNKKGGKVRGSYIIYTIPVNYRIFRAGSESKIQKLLKSKDPDPKQMSSYGSTTLIRKKAKICAFCAPNSCKTGAATGSCIKSTLPVPVD